MSREHEWALGRVRQGNPTMECVRWGKVWYPDSTERQLGSCQPPELDTAPIS